MKWITSTWDQIDAARYAQVDGRLLFYPFGRMRRGYAIDADRRDRLARVHAFGRWSVPAVIIVQLGLMFALQARLPLDSWQGIAALFGGAAVLALATTGLRAAIEWRILKGAPRADAISDKETEKRRLLAEPIVSDKQLLFALVVNGGFGFLTACSLIFGKGDDPLLPTTLQLIMLVVWLGLAIASAVMLVRRLDYLNGRAAGRP